MIQNSRPTKLNEVGVTEFADIRTTAMWYYRQYEINSLGTRGVKFNVNMFTPIFIKFVQLPDGADMQETMMEI